MFVAEPVDLEGTKIVLVVVAVVEAFVSAQESRLKAKSSVKRLDGRIVSLSLTDPKRQKASTLPRGDLGHWSFKYAAWLPVAAFFNSSLP